MFYRQMFRIQIVMKIYSHDVWRIQVVVDVFRTMLKSILVQIYIAADHSRFPTAVTSTSQPFDVESSHPRGVL